ncbi:hypothetical protein SNE40_010025 [Patella caerulea]|uniref:Uncharacterized protein n=1 Tax=Patella caerulea TaxID=87958 RepID=A0AAN8JWW8_PATCE
MRSFIILAVCAVLVASEDCQNTNDCRVTTCSGAVIRCIQNICTCVTRCPDGIATCRNRENCIEDANQHNCNCRDEYHCIDNHCYCGYPNGK